VVHSFSLHKLVMVSFLRVVIMVVIVVATLWRIYTNRSAIVKFPAESKLLPET
jgi:hypothetical protein